MRKTLLLTAALVAAAPLLAQDKPPEVPSPPEIVAAAPTADWTAIAASDLLVMDLAPDTKGKARRVMIQLLPAPLSQGWTGNIRKLAAARFWDGLSINRVQDNYVVQWGDAGEEAKAKALPEGLAAPNADAYRSPHSITTKRASKLGYKGPGPDAYAASTAVLDGWPVGFDKAGRWPVHCYAMVGVGRDLPPNTGTGADLYTVIGHAPRHLDRNIALVGRVIEGIEHLSSLPRGTGPLGFYETAQERVPILSVRIGTEVKDLPTFEYLSTESKSFARYADARANRRDAFFIRPAGGADICNIPVPVRRSAGSR